MMGRNMTPGGNAVKQWAGNSNTFTAQGNASLTITLPSGQTGKPVIMRGSGSVSGQITLTYGNVAQVIVPINPNAPYSEVVIPPAAFPSPTSSVVVTVTGDAAGVIRCLIGFA